MPVDGSLPNSPNPGDIAKTTVVDRERKKNMYFSAIGFINDVKTGPFWEHSPILFDISGVRAGWGKINKVCVHFQFVLESSNPHLGHDQNVQWGGLIKVPCGSAFPIWIFI